MRLSDIYRGLSSAVGRIVGRGATRRDTSPRAKIFRHARAIYDAAETSAENRRHWANADGLSADAAASAEVRRTLRNRARYEVANNSYARGIVITLANDTIGTGPRLQMLTPYPELNRTIEAEFSRWARAVMLAEKLRTMRMAKAQDGEAFAILATNPNVDHAIKLDMQLVEADQVATPFFTTEDENEIDGIILDEFGNPIKYRVLRDHPGSGKWRADNSAFTIIPASSMIHLFRQDRPGQHRGIPEIAPALPLFAQLRRYTLAVISAAEAAANFAGILYTDAPPNGESDAVEPMDLIELERNMLMTMPGGWKMAQLEPAQPSTTYSEFKKEILNEIARCLNMPFNIAAGNSSGYNYASGRLDHQTYFKSIRVEQHYIAARMLDRVLSVWLAEFALLNGARALLDGAPPHQWFWDGFEHVDPQKEASAQEIRLKNYTTTLAQEYAKMGMDWEDALRQRAKEAALLKSLGLAQPADSSEAPSGENETETEEKTEDAVSE